MFGRFSFWQRLVGRTSGAAVAEADLPETDRRVWVRYPANLATTLQATAGTDQSRFSALVRDISRGGAHLLVNRTFQPGDLLSVELPAADGHGVHTVLACVVRVAAQENGEWVLGCIFSRELNDEDLEGLGAKRQKHPPSDQRTWMRFPCQVKATYQAVGSSQSLSPAEVLNISASGIGLLVDQTIEMGSLLNVELQPASGKDSARTILACVVHANQEGTQWALGCNFIRELTEEDLKALVPT